MNVLYIHTHDSGDYFSPYGYRVETPNLQKFADDAVKFDQAFSCSPTCSPSRGALLSGLYPHRNGLIGFGNRGFRFHDYQDHMVATLNANGYTTVLCGIQHEIARYTDHALACQEIGYQVDLTTDHTMFEEKEMVYWDDNNVEQLCRWLGQSTHSRPFFASMGFFSTHREYLYEKTADLDAIDMPKFLVDNEITRKDMGGHVKTLQHFDHNFGKIIDTLKATGLYENTIIYFTTDHGIPFPHAKCTLFDAGFKVAFLMRVPQSKTMGTAYAPLISQVDVVPTLYELLHIAPKKKLDGISFASVFQGRTKPIRSHVYGEVNFHTSYEPMRCVRRNNTI